MEKTSDCVTDMKKATLTREQQVLIGLAVNDYCKQMIKLASDLESFGKTDNADKRMHDADLLTDAYWKITWSKEWKVEE